MTQPNAEPTAPGEGGGEIGELLDEGVALLERAAWDVHALLRGTASQARSLVADLARDGRGLRRRLRAVRVGPEPAEASDVLPLPREPRAG